MWERPELEITPCVGEGVLKVGSLNKQGPHHQGTHRAGEVGASTSNLLNQKLQNCGLGGPDVTERLRSAVFGEEQVGSFKQ